mmetsp:Transcript_5122/g.5857  ORF Transcript_5122/g.5857 Transcript_5122/m.5857 type:complete len:267 (+) Transcript_5122:66-866(+)|eukprot:CAMPEP_0205805726 /NCGR_PEP_ID=MMETSP0205-20121125/9047_1 /ASSEMBLY_ACC=CAM_ASM_000278 /TAXON_ID=36767 /ORGANISM="Euplotes focardii, Strain TN1" /LENGTH=266 /DNA_ID=CAMNT_0053077427 /DNA_START=11 /DNA_END=811 /DNA_ORIENTATION=+
MPRQSIKNQRKSTLKRWKTFNEKEILESYFKLDTAWSRKTINYVKDLVQLSEEQIYKWGYEKKRKLTITINIVKVSASAQISRIDEEDLSKTLNYNDIVAELFPESDFVDDKLDTQELQKYDELRDRMMIKDAEIKQMNELDQILYERLPTSFKNQKKLSSRSRKSSTDDNCTELDTICKEEEQRESQEDTSFLQRVSIYKDSERYMENFEFAQNSSTNKEIANESESKFFDYIPNDYKMSADSGNEKFNDLPSFSEDNTPFAFLS